MKNWFDLFHRDLQEKTLSTKLIAAGTSTPERAFQHYRFQHEFKIREATEETFPTLKELTDWEATWKQFRASGPPSPRSMDRYPEIFLDYYLKSEAPHHLRELARFEHILDVHPWTHDQLDVLPLPDLTENTRLLVSSLDVHHFRAPVREIYLGEAPSNLQEKCTLLFWYKDWRVHFRRMEAWELEVLKNLHRGFGFALEHAPDDAALVGEFFQWLGSSGVVRGILH